MTEQLTQHNIGGSGVARTTGLSPPGRSWSQGGSSGGSECFSAVMHMPNDGDLQITSPRMSWTCPGLLAIAKYMPLLLSHDSRRTLGFTEECHCYGRQRRDKSPMTETHFITNPTVPVSWHQGIENQQLWLNYSYFLLK